MKMEGKIYLLTTANRVMLGEKITEFRHFKLILVNFLDITREKTVIDYQLIQQKMEDTATIHRWTADIEELQNHLLLNYKIKEQSISIDNHDELLNKWVKEMKNKLSNKFQIKGSRQMIYETERLLKNKTEFEKGFLGYNSFRTLLNSYIYATETKHDLDLKNFFGKDLHLNLSILSKIEENTVLNSAEINNAKFNHRALTKMLRNITHSMDLKPEIGVDMEEIFVFNEDRTPKQVDLYLDVAVIDGFYQTTMAHQLFELTEDEMLDISLKWKKDNETTQKEFTFLAD